MYLFIEIFFRRHILLPGLSIAVLISAMLGTTYPALQASVNQTECYELLTNGSLNSYDSWFFGKTNYIASIVKQDIYEGTGSLRVGISEGISNRLAHSTAYQRVSIPENINSLKISYWKRSGGNADGVDYRETLILSDDFVTVLATVERDFSEGSNQWVEVTQDLTEQLRTQAGQEMILYTNVYNNGKGSQMWQYLDAISLMACMDNSEPTATVVVPSQDVLVPTETPEVTVDPLVESNATIQLGSNTTAFGSDQGAFIPLNILNVPDGFSVGETTMELVYDWSSLRVTGCKEEIEPQVSQFLCNYDEPGIIRIAATSAQGLAGNSQLTEIKFVSLIQPINQEVVRSQPIDLAIVSFNDLQGSSIDVTTTPGEITLQCLRGDVNCDSKADGIDSLSILQYAVKMKTPSLVYPVANAAQQIFLPACDVNGNLDCDAIDSLFISQCEIGLSNSFCPERNDNLARDLRDVPNRPSNGNIIRVAEVQASATGRINVPVTAEIVGSSLNAATIDLTYDPTILKVVDCIQNPENDFDQVICNPNLDSDGVDLDQIGFVATSFRGNTGQLTMVTIVFEVLSEIDETTASALFRLQARTFADGDGQRLIYTVEGVGSNQIYLPMIQK